MSIRLNGAHTPTKWHEFWEHSSANIQLLPNANWLSCRIHLLKHSRKAAVPLDQIHLMRVHTYTEVRFRFFMLYAFLVFYHGARPVEPGFTNEQWETWINILRLRVRRKYFKRPPAPVYENRRYANLL